MAFPDWHPSYWEHVFWHLLIYQQSTEVKPKMAYFESFEHKFKNQGLKPIEKII